MPDFECIKCGFKTGDWNEWIDHEDHHKHIESQGIEDTQGLIKKDLLLDE